MGPDYADRGTGRLLARSRRQEEEGDRDAALATAEVLIALAPQNVLGHDRAARLYYLRGDFDRAAVLLGAGTGWSRPIPCRWWPGRDRGAARQRRRPGAGRPPGAGPDARRPASRHRDPGARLVLTANQGLGAAESLLQEALREEADNTEALGLLAAVRSAAGDRRPGGAGAVDEPAAGAGGRFHYLAARLLPGGGRRRAGSKRAAGRGASRRCWWSAAT